MFTSEVSMKQWSRVKAKNRSLDRAKKVAITGTFTLFVIVLSSCVNHESELSVFYTKTDEILKEDEKECLLECSDIECVIEFVFLNTNEELQRHFDSLSNSMIEFLKAENVVFYPKYTLLVGYNKDRRGQEYSFSEIDMQIDSFFKAEAKKNDIYFEKIGN